MPIVPAPAVVELRLSMDELRVIREAMSAYTQRDNLDETRTEAAWAVLAEVMHKVGKAVT